MTNDAKLAEAFLIPKAFLIGFESGEIEQVHEAIAEIYAGEEADLDIQAIKQSYEEGVRVYCEFVD